MEMMIDVKSFKVSDHLGQLRMTLLESTPNFDLRIMRKLRP